MLRFTPELFQPAIYIPGATEPGTSNHKFICPLHLLMDSQRALCYRCLSLFRGRLRQAEIAGVTQASRYGVHHATALKFQCSVEQGCRICVFLWNTFAEARAEMLLAPVSDKGFLSYKVLYKPSGFGDDKFTGTITFVLNNCIYSRMDPYIPWNYLFQLLPIDGKSNTIQ